jgi:hypothetical protein
MPRPDGVLHVVQHRGSRQRKKKPAEAGSRLRAHGRVTQPAARSADQARFFNAAAPKLLRSTLAVLAAAAIVPFSFAFAVLARTVIHLHVTFRRAGAHA